MSGTEAKITKADVLERLDRKYVKESGRTEVRFDGHCIGGIVQFGRHVGLSRSRVKTVFASRIYGSKEFGLLKIEEEAASTRSLMDKVAAALARKFKDGSIAWPRESVVEASADDEPSAPAFR